MSKTILTVDDSPSMLQLLQITLSRGGYDVIQAHDGEEALAKIDEHAPALVITDIAMPKINGLDLVRALRGRENARFMPILVLTTDASDTVRDQGRAAGATGWIVKPFEPGQLLTMVRTVIG